MITYTNGLPYILPSSGIPQEISFEEAGRMERELRQSRIDKLIASTKVYSVLEEDIIAIFEEFKNQVDQYIAIGSSSFKVAITNETGTAIATRLDKLANPSNGFTIRDSILFELNK
jgi:hypothetical protein